MLRQCAIACDILATTRTAGDILPLRTVLYSAVSHWSDERPLDPVSDGGAAILVGVSCHVASRLLNEATPSPASKSIAATLVAVLRSTDGYASAAVRGVLAARLHQFTAVCNDCVATPRLNAVARRIARPLLSSWAEVTRASFTDTFKVATSVHDVLDVGINVMSILLNGPVAGGGGLLDPEATTPVELTVHSATLAPLLAEWGAALQAARERAAESRLGDSGAHDSVERRVLELALPPLMHTLANWMHCAAARYPDNMSAFYTMAVVVADVVQFLAETGAATMEQGLPQRAAGGAAGYFPDDAVQARSKLRVLVGVATDKVRGEIRRIVSAAATDFSVPESTDAPIHPSGALLSALCGVAQPLTAVLLRSPLDDAAQVAAKRRAAAPLLRAVVEQVVLGWLEAAERSKKAKPLAAIAEDLTLFRKFWMHHPWVRRDEAMCAILWGCADWSRVDTLCGQRT
jgi:hypothetical protein